ncbi:MAG: monofunctional biosynthetic peptidoglycan transglycosylase [Dysgonamonadaceae bacterium]|jgi:monofunctional biosynthetic peptidoglycan transglycosylase|nr:monofunctional biosynthetic peptidoglycan transglycosylase [Dysgonamonadaceae bacterium]
MKKILLRIARWLRNLLLFLFVFSLFMVLLYKWVPVYTTPTMVQFQISQWTKNDKEKVEFYHKWMPLESISRNLQQAVVASEDNLFLLHSGIDYKAIEIARKEAERGRRLRGASTISQQTAKNVFLWQNRSWIRKGLETYFTFLIEFVWGKERIMEVYLNSIEMGNGIYGAEAVARRHFNKPASRLTAPEAALIAASLPNPKRFNSARPSAYMLKRQVQIMSLMDKIVPVNFDDKTKKEKASNPPQQKKRKSKSTKTKNK